VRQTLGFLALSLGPYLAYSAFLLAWLGSLSEAGDISPVPFLGLVHPPWRLSRQGIDGVFVIVPALVALIALLPREPLRSPSWRPWFLLAANVLLAVVFYGRLYEASYTTEGRVATGIVLSALLCLPYVGGLSARRRGWLVAAAALALAPLPLVALHGFVSIRA
jgi:hypothetical protein